MASMNRAEPVVGLIFGTFSEAAIFSTLVNRTEQDRLAKGGQRCAQYSRTFADGAFVADAALTRGRVALPGTLGYAAFVVGAEVAGPCCGALRCTPRFVALVGVTEMTVRGTASVEMAAMDGAFVADTVAAVFAGGSKRCTPRAPACVLFACERSR